MKAFNDKNFVLETEVAQNLFHNHAAKMPIIDYHCHLTTTSSRASLNYGLVGTTISGAPCVPMV